MPEPTVKKKLPLWLKVFIAIVIVAIRPDYDGAPGDGHGRAEVVTGCAVGGDELLDLSPIVGTALFPGKDVG